MDDDKLGKSLNLNFVNPNIVIEFRTWEDT
jgi:hypothetical protein